MKQNSFSASLRARNIVSSFPRSAQTLARIASQDPKRKESRRVEIDQETSPAKSSGEPHWRSGLFCESGGAKEERRMERDRSGGSGGLTGQRYSVLRFFNRHCWGWVWRRGASQTVVAVPRCTQSPWPKAGLKISVEKASCWFVVPYLLSHPHTRQIVSGLQKGPAERGHIKNCHDKFRQFSCRAKNVKNRQKVSQSSTFARTAPLLFGNSVQNWCIVKGSTFLVILCNGALGVPWSLRPRNRVVAATCGRGRCELLAISRVTPKIASDCGLFASPVAATVGHCDCAKRALCR